MEITDVDIDKAADDAARNYHRIMLALGMTWKGYYDTAHLPTEDEVIDKVRELVARLIRNGASWISSGGIDVRVAIREGAFAREDGKPGHMDIVTLDFTHTIGRAVGKVVYDV